MSTIAMARWPRGSLAITEGDLLWLARSIAGETDDAERSRAAVAWSELQRAVVWLDTGIRSTSGMRCAQAEQGAIVGPVTLTTTVRCFSQPVNPYWLRRGDDGQVRRRAFLSTASYQELESRHPPRATWWRGSPGLRDFVYRWAAGKVPNPVPGLADFSAPGLSDVPRGAVVIGGNAFFPEGASARWPDHYVSIEPVSGWGTLAKLLAATGGALVVAGVVVTVMERRA